MRRKVCDNNSFFIARNIKNCVILLTLQQGLGQQRTFMAKQHMNDDRDCAWTQWDRTALDSWSIPYGLSRVNIAAHPFLCQVLNVNGNNLSICGVRSFFLHRRTSVDISSFPFGKVKDVFGTFFLYLLSALNRLTRSQIISFHWLFSA